MIVFKQWLIFYFCAGGTCANCQEESWGFLFDLFVSHLNPHSSHLRNAVIHLALCEPLSKAGGRSINVCNEDAAVLRGRNPVEYYNKFLLMLWNTGIIMLLNLLLVLSEDSIRKLFLRIRTGISAPQQLQPSIRSSNKIY